MWNCDLGSTSLSIRTTCFTIAQKVFRVCVVARWDGVPTFKFACIPSDPCSLPSPLPVALLFFFFWRARPKKVSQADSPKNRSTIDLGQLISCPKTSYRLPLRDHRPCPPPTRVQSNAMFRYQTCIYTKRLQSQSQSSVRSTIKSWSQPTRSLLSISNYFSSFRNIFSFQVTFRNSSTFSSDIVCIAFVIVLKFTGRLISWHQLHPATITSTLPFSLSLFHSFSLLTLLRHHLNTAFVLSRTLGSSLDLSIESIVVISKLLLFSSSSSFLTFRAICALIQSDRTNETTVKPATSRKGRARPLKIGFDSNLSTAKNRKLLVASVILYVREPTPLLFLASFPIVRMCRQAFVFTNTDANSNISRITRPDSGCIRTFEQTNAISEHADILVCICSHCSIPHWSARTWFAIISMIHRHSRFLLPFCFSFVATHAFRRTAVVLHCFELLSAAISFHENVQTWR